MAVNVARFEWRDQIAWGVVRGDKLVRVPGAFSTTGEFIANTSVEALAALEGETIGLGEVALLSPITGNQQFLCQGANYRQHMIESGMDPDQKRYNMIFTKAQSCLCAANSHLVKPASVRFLDYEIELGIVLRRDIRKSVQVTDANLLDFLAGLVIVNDYSARDIQLPQSQFYKGKSFRTFGPVGPFLCLLTAADLPKLFDLRLTLTVNGQIRQDDTTANMVYRPAETLSELSGVQDLFAGDLIATGTPSGCALAIPSPAIQRVAALMPEATKWRLFLKAQAKRTQYLQPGDIVEAVIASPDGAIDLGRQRNFVVEEGSR